VNAKGWANKYVRQIQRIEISLPSHLQRLTEGIARAYYYLVERTQIAAYLAAINRDPLEGIPLGQTLGHFLEPGEFR
jgi:hypothetical protein